MNSKKKRNDPPIDAPLIVKGGMTIFSPKEFAAYVTHLNKYAQRKQRFEQQHGVERAVAEGTRPKPPVAAFCITRLDCDLGYTCNARGECV